MKKVRVNKEVVKRNIAAIGAIVLTVASVKFSYSVVKQPEKYLSTWALQLIVDIEQEDAEAISYAIETYGTADIKELRELINYQN